MNVAAAQEATVDMLGKNIGVNVVISSKLDVHVFRTLGWHLTSRLLFMLESSVIIYFRWLEFKTSNVD